MTNAIKYANSKDPDMLVHILINISEDDLVIKVFDKGQGFDINSVKPPNFEQLEDRGRGIFLIRSLMDSVCYKKHRNGNVLAMSKKLR